MDINYNYKVFLTGDIDLINWSNCVHSLEEVRYNLSKDKFIVRLLDSSLEEDTLSHEEALILMSTLEWEDIEI
jgi:hypothetical protein